MYDFDWHKLHGDRTSASAERIVDLLADCLPINSVLDVGCGDGRWLSACRAKGSAVIAGVDGPWTDLARLVIPAETVTIHDLARPFNLGRRFDLAISLEVGEHIAAHAAATFADNLARHSDAILFGAAIPFQGGFRHINEQWQSYWAAAFKARGYVPFDLIRGRIWNDPAIYFWYKQNAILYVHEDNLPLRTRVEDHLRLHGVQQLPLDIVHPEKYDAVASYTTISFKPLLRQLPRRTAAKVYAMMRRKG